MSDSEPKQKNDLIGTMRQIDAERMRRIGRMFSPMLPAVPFGPVDPAAFYRAQLEEQERRKRDAEVRAMLEQIDQIGRDSGLERRISRVLPDRGRSRDQDGHLKDEIDRCDSDGPKITVPIDKPKDRAPRTGDPTAGEVAEAMAQFERQLKPQGGPR